MKRTREESTYGGEPAHHPDVQQIEIDNVQELQRWVVRNWEENTTNILAIERLWKDCKPLKLLKKELDCTGSGTHPIWKEMEIVSLPQLETDSAKKRSFCVVVRDVTKMRNELDNLSDFFDNGGLCLHWVGPDGKILRANRQELDFLGYSPEEYIGKSIIDFHADGEVIADILARLARGERLANYPARLRCKDGSIKNVLIDSSVLFSENGEFLHTRCFTRDVTQQKRMEQELLKAKADAENASKAKDIFLAVLSHELRTPLTPVILTVPVICQDPRIPNDTKEQLEMVTKNLEVEVRLIDDLLDLTAVSRGRVQLSKTDVDMHNLIWQTVQLLSAELDQKLLHTSFLLRSIKNRKLIGDPLRLQQVLRNVLRNAIKYTPPGGMLSIKSRDCESSDQVELEITDTGEGIDPTMLPHIFEAFQQGDRLHGGLGLGLAIARAIVSLHGGSIIAKSQGIGYGTTVLICLPPSHAIQYPTSNSPPQPSLGMPLSPAVAKAAPLKILLIEDDPSTRMALARLLQMKFHHVVQVAATGNEALSLFASNSYNLIISDIGLPDYTGHDLLPKFLALRPQQKAIALSGYGMPQDIQRSLSVGFMKHLTKPVTIAALQEAICGVLDK